MEVAHVWVLAVAWVEWELAIVPQVGDDVGDEDRWILAALAGIGGSGVSNVLAVATTTWSPEDKLAK
jgi:hypothetical protein